MSHSRTLFGLVCSWVVFIQEVVEFSEESGTTPSSEFTESFFHRRIPSLYPWMDVEDMRHDKKRVPCPTKLMTKSLMIIESSGDEFQVEGIFINHDELRLPILTTEMLVDYWL